VAVLGHKEAEVLIAFLGVVKARHPYVPIEPALPRRRVERIVAAAGCKLTLTPETTATLTNSAARPPQIELRPSDPYYIMFTSGSTGDPKGVVITRSCLSSFLEWMLAAHHFDEDETFLNQVSYSFDVSVMDTYTGLLSGGMVLSVTTDDINNPKRLYQLLMDSGVTTWVSTPSFVSMCLAERTFAASMLPRLRRVLLCGETLPPEVAGQLLDRFPNAEVWNTYGPTEATVATTSIRIDRELLARYSHLPVGSPMPGTRIVVVDASDRSVKPGERGEIVIAGPNVSPGYVGEPALSARAFFELDGMRAYRTGDWGYYQDGLLFCEGRMDDQVKLHGYRIELGDVETNVRSIPGVRDVVVLPVLKENRPDSLAAFVILSERPQVSDFEMSRRLRAHLAERLPAYMLPRKFFFLDTFPMTANGKADRRCLAARLT
jgi:D-alanine--poly(phosphoribitol) ligase subunit 1